ncbi:MAG: trypsin-like peptidase domain-containing protein [Candidatus Euphemobacter frigidus]|nr:trypsin-like peptidase domain-containing protein [Candidatus Euphemobacter frigidus]MDP8276475.1 trypsin-like peptidase domain-containing protein [Candidatus Euphemobacter frigidus]
MTNSQLIKLSARLAALLLILTACSEQTETGTSHSPSPGREEIIQPPISILDHPGLARRIGTEIADAVEKALPSVVVVRTESIRSQPARDSLWGYLLSVPRRELGQGSGVIITPEGYILTCNHVVLDAREIEVILHDGTAYPAELIGRDIKSDLAVLKIEGTGEEFIPLPPADSDRVRVGEFAVAIGSPFALSGSVTIGIISQKGRSVGLLPYEDFIQTDASINPGNSGGPLIDVDGRLIGINDAITTAGPLSRGNLGIGFAVPSNLAMDIAHAIIKEGAYRRPRIGIMLGQLSPARARKFLDRNSGVFIDFVFINSPAEKARLMPGDIIIKVDDNPVNTIREVQRAVIKHQLNEPVILTINREGEEKAVTVYTGQGSEYE